MFVLENFQSGRFDLEFFHPQINFTLKSSISTSIDEIYFLPHRSRGLVNNSFWSKKNKICLKQHKICEKKVCFQKMNS